MKHIVLGTAVSLLVYLSALACGLAAAFISQGNLFNMSLLVSTAAVLAPFAGGFAAGFCIRKKGWIKGGWVGLAYSIVLWFAAAVIFPGAAGVDLGRFFFDLCAGCIGGICGVNTGLYVHRQKRKRMPAVQTSVSNRT